VTKKPNQSQQQPTSWHRNHRNALYEYPYVITCQSQRSRQWCPINTGSLATTLLTILNFLALCSSVNNVWCTQ